MMGVEAGSGHEELNSYSLECVCFKMCSSVLNTCFRTV